MIVYKPNPEIVEVIKIVQSDGSHKWVMYFSLDGKLLFEKELT